jgi:transposase
LKAAVAAFHELQARRRREVWVMDEHRLGLKPILRRVWALPGQRPMAPVHHRYEWLYVYGFVQPTSGRSFWLLMPTVSVPAFNLALYHFAQFAGAGPDLEIRLLVDQAGFHTSPHVALPPGLRLWFLPPYSPELQPAEHVWPLVDEPVVNRYFETLDALQTVLAGRCVWLQDHPDIVRSTTNFHWWPQSV